jgi:HD superfamily phosphohydrolase
MSIVKLLKLSWLALIFTCNVNAQIIHTVFGDIDEKNPVVLELINSKAIQRLKDIDQSGPTPYFNANFPKFSRYDHSLGVYALLKKFNVSENEQIAGLMHDASHTVFSHLADIIFQSGAQRTDSYQDDIHDWFLTQMDVDKILVKHNLSIKDISPKNPKFTALEQPYPDMNADRIEYNLHTALTFNDLDHHDVQGILNSLNYKNKQWYFSSITHAKKFAKLSTYYTKTSWGDAQNVAVYTATAAALKYAIEQKLMSTNDLNFGIDQDIVTLLKKSNDPILRELVAIINNIENHYVVTNKQDYDVYQPVKMRGIDPLVLINNKLIRLSSLSLDFNKDLQETKRYSQNGIYLKFTNINNKQILNLLIKSNA